MRIRLTNSIRELDEGFAASRHSRERGLMPFVPAAKYPTFWSCFSGMERSDRARRGCGAELKSIAGLCSQRGICRAPFGLRARIMSCQLQAFASANDKASADRRYLRPTLYGLAIVVEILLHGDARLLRCRRH